MCCAPGSPRVRNGQAGVNLEAGSTIFQAVRTDCPLSYVKPDVRTGIILALTTRLSVSEDMSQANLFDQVLYKRAARRDLGRRQFVATVLVSLPAFAVRIRKVSDELHSY